MTSLLPDNITIENASAMIKTLCVFVDNQPAGEVVVDLSSVGYFDSAGVAMLLELMRYAIGTNHRVSYQAPNRQLSELAQFLKVDALLFRQM